MDAVCYLFVASSGGSKDSCLSESLLPCLGVGCVKAVAFATGTHLFHAYLKQAMALDTLSNEIRRATTSMSGVARALEFLRPMYGTLKGAYDRMPPGENRGKLADIINVLATTTSDEGPRESLKFRLAGNTVRALNHLEERERRRLWSLGSFWYLETRWCGKAACG